jgi:hypothetical protein
LALDTETLKQRLAKQRWTGHNLRLNDEVTTWPGHSDFDPLDLRLKAIRRILRFTFGDQPGKLRIADLGALEGGYSLALARQGAEVIGVEARKLNFDKLALLEEHFALPNLKFVMADVKEFTAERYGAFDVVLALGILYHLDRPVEWLRQVAAATRRLIVIDSHFAPADDHALSKIDPRLSALSALETVTYNGISYQGRWFKEFEPTFSPEEELWASYSNWRSFWLTKGSLVRAIRDAGFDLVLEQHDYSADSHDRLAIEFPRTMIVGLKLN